MGKSDFDFLGLALATVGLFFICCATLHKKPRHILEEAFGIYRGGLRDLKSSVFKRNQVVLGFLCVVLAIVVNIFGESHPDNAGFMASIDTPRQIAILLVGMTALCGILNYLSRLWSKAAFKRLVHEVVTEYQWPFEENMVLTREIGKLLGVPQRDDDTVESYVSRIRHHLKIPLPLPPTSEGRPRRASRLG
ncbi:MAG: hypothetical protein KDB53_01590 [Planctomycetes bacterium]|nr:hypothetical protein [Planctomycetota bacterium]